MKRPATAEDILSLARNFMECRILLTGAELDLFTLATEPRSSAELAESQGWHVRPLTVVLDALAAMGLLIKHDGRYRTDPDLLPFLDKGSAQSVLPMVRHVATMWTHWSDLTRIVTETGGADTIPSRFDGEDQKAFIGAMHVAGRQRAAEVVRVILTSAGPGARPDSALRLLDVGGASGTYTIAFLEASPGMRATLFDLPEVIDLAEARIAEAGLQERVDFVRGDFYTDPLPTGCDLALLSAIIHQNGPEQNLALYRKVRAALEPGGRLVIRDFVMHEERTSPPGGALFAVNMLVATPQGATYTFAEIREGLAAAGFERITLLEEREDMMSLVEAYRPE